MNARHRVSKMLLRHGRLGVARPPEHRINEDARRGDLASRALPSQFERAARVAADVANGGDAAGQPDIQLVLDRFAPAFLLQMGVGIDEPGEHVLAGSVDHCIRRRPAPPAAPAKSHRIERDHIGDGVVFDENILGPAGRRAVAVHYRGVMDQQAVHPLSVGGGLRHGGGGQQDESGEKTLRHGLIVPQPVWVMPLFDKLRGGTS